MIEFEPFAYDHSARLVNLRPWRASRHPDLLFQSLSAAIKRYRLRHCLVGMDIYNVEAEALGCVVAEPEGDGSPSISQPICRTQAELLKLELDDLQHSRYPWILETADKLRNAFPTCSFRIPLAGPFTLAGHLLGLDNLLCDLLLNPDETRTSLEHLAEISLNFARQAVEMDYELTLFESSASPPMLSPNLFRSHLKPVLEVLLSKITLPEGTRPQLIMGGNTLPILEEIVALHPAYIICPIETDQLEFMKKIQEMKPALRVRVNMQPGVFVEDSPEAAIQEASRTLRLAEMIPNTCIGTILPFNTSPHVVDAVSALVASQQEFQGG